MRIGIDVGPNGQAERKIDFEGASLPDGRSIDEVLGENILLKEKVDKLETEIENSSSILVRIIPNRKLRIIVEIILMVGTAIGIMSCLFSLKQ